MSDIFSASEIIELGIQIEKNGRDFYASLSAQVKDKKAQGVFSYLSGEEGKHIATFQQILASVRKYEPQETYPGEYSAYMKALANEHIFTKKGTGTVTAKKAKTDRDAVELSIGFEKDSITFYEGMKKVVSEDDVRAIDGLIAQEEMHLRKLSDLKAALT